jgi:hypothetical protein
VNELSSVKKIWSEFWGQNAEIGHSKITFLIEDFMMELEPDKQDKLLRKSISLFRSTSILYRWIYFKTLMNEEPDPEIVMTIDPKDLPRMDIKKGLLKETSTSVKALNKLKKLLIELSEQSFILENNKLLDTFIHPSQKDVVSVDTQQKPEQIWKIITKVLNNIQDEEIVSQLGDFKSEFDETIEDLRTDWLIWSEFISSSKVYDLYDEEARTKFTNWSLSQIELVNPDLFKRNILFDVQKSKIISTYWKNPNDIELINKYKKETIIDECTCGNNTIDHSIFCSGDFYIDPMAEPEYRPKSSKESVCSKCGLIKIDSQFKNDNNICSDCSS